MNIDRLKKLADVVEHGVYEFPELSQLVALDMSVEFALTADYKRSVRRSDIPDRDKLTAYACGIGFTILLFSQLGSRVVSDRDFAVEADLRTEAKLLLDLTDKQADALFYGRLSSHITGPEYARVIRGFIMTENVDWMSILA